MHDPALSFLTPYWSGREMMEAHLASIRRFHPRASILVSKRGGGQAEMDDHRRRFSVQYWLEDCEYEDAYFRLLVRCPTEYACVIDHDAVLVAGLDPLLQGLIEGRYDLVGVEERIREPRSMDWAMLRPEYRGWMRFAPGCVASNFLLFNLGDFRQRWGLRGVLGRRMRDTKDFEFDYGIGQKLRRHKYLMPYHCAKYGLGNLLCDGDAGIVWHQWYGAHRDRMATEMAGAAEPGVTATLDAVHAGEKAFLADFPDPDFSGLTPAWGEGIDIAAERQAFAIANQRALAQPVARAFRRLKRWAAHGPAGIRSRIVSRLARWWLLRRG